MKWYLMSLWLASLTNELVCGGTIYFEEDVHILTVVKNYSHLTDTARQLLEVTAKLDTSKLNDNLQLQKLKSTCIKSVEGKAEKFANIKMRAKRALDMEFLGSAWKWVSGTPDAEDWRDNMDALRQLSRGLNITEKGVERILFHEKQTDAFLNRTEVVLEKLELSEQRLQRESATMEQRLRYSISVMDICFELQILLGDLEEEHNELKLTRALSHMDFVSEELIPTSTLVSSLSKLAGKGRLTPLWTAMEVHQYYQNKLAKVQVRDLVAVAHLRIPLIDKSKAYEAHHTSMPNGEKIAIEKSRQSYRYMSREEVETCENLITGDQLCHGRVTGIYKARHLCTPEECTTGTRLPFDRLLEIDQVTFAYRFSEKSSATMTCPDKRERIELKTSGIIRLETNCRISGDSFFINPKPKGTQKNVTVVNEVRDWAPAFEVEAIISDLRNISSRLTDHLIIHDTNATNLTKESIRLLKGELQSVQSSLQGTNISNAEVSLSTAHERISHMEGRVQHHTIANTALIGTLVLVFIVAASCFACRINMVNGALAGVNTLMRNPLRRSNRLNQPRNPPTDLELQSLRRTPETPELASGPAAAHQGHQVNTTPGFTTSVPPAANSD